MKATALAFFPWKKPYSLLSPNTLKKHNKKRSVYAHVAYIPAFEWAVNSKSVVLAGRRKWLACKFKKASKKRIDKLMIVFDHDKIIHAICKNSVLQVAEIVEFSQKESNTVLILQPK